MKCPKCKGEGEFFWDDHCQGMFMECDMCHGTGEVQTNEEWFDTLSTKEKAKWLDGLIAYCFGVGHITESEQKKYQKIVADVELWLKQPHQGE